MKSKKFFAYSKLVVLGAVLSLSQFVLAKDLLNYKTVVDLSKHSGTPYFEVMRTEIKPKLDYYATEGFIMADGKTISKVLDNVSPKVKRGALRGSSEEILMKVADSIREENKRITFYELPWKLSSTRGFKGDKYDLTTFYALASGGGVAVKMNEDVWAYNVNYGTGEIDKDEMTGRSFGAVNNVHKADDASDAAYLKALEKIARPLYPDGGKDIHAFTRGVLEIVVSSDPGSINKMSDSAKAVLSDFVAVYTAEQDRHLMANLRSHHWDSALLEVTLLANFHAGQKKIEMYFEADRNDIKFTDTVPDQNLARKKDYRGNIYRSAGMVDYWQFSRNPQNPNRSGINLTRPAFSRLERKISDYERKHNPEIVRSIEKLLVGVKLTGNIFDNVSDYLINFKTQKDVKKNGRELIEAYLLFLDQVRKDADKITTEIKKSGN